MQIMHNLIWFGERCKRLNINENWATHILSLNMGTNDKPFFYSLVLFLRVSKYSIIVLCQSFIKLMEFLKPSSTQRNTIFVCMDSLIGAKKRWWMFDPTPQRSDVTWSHNSTFAPMVHSMMISATISCKRIRARSMGANEPFSTSTLSKQLSSSMVVNPPMSTMPTSSTKSGCNPHPQTHHHAIVSMSS